MRSRRCARQLAAGALIVVGLETVLGAADSRGLLAAVVDAPTSGPTRSPTSAGDGAIAGPRSSGPAAR